MHDGTAFYEANKTDHVVVDDRVRAILKGVLRAQPASILDIGCGRGMLLSEIRTHLPHARLVGVDISESSAAQTRSRGFEVDAADVSCSLPFAADTFDCVIFGEIIEHLVDPDTALVNIATVLQHDGLLILTTPNLASWFNRVLLLLGIQPVFTETSLHANLGRGWPIFGQYGHTQGHLKIFTLGALREMLQANGFVIERVVGVPYARALGGPLDALLSRVPTLASNFVVTARNSATRVTAYPQLLARER